MCYVFLASLFSRADLGWGRRMDWVVSHSPFGEAKHKKKKLKKIVNGMAEIKANALDGYLFVISTLWHC